MNKENFTESFEKIYSKSYENIYVRKAPYPLVMLGAEVSECEKRVIGAGITPDTFIGVRAKEEESISVRETSSEIMYECPVSRLGEYREKDWAKEVFSVLAKISKESEITGTEILFHSECGEEEFKNRIGALISSFIPEGSTYVSYDSTFLEEAKRLIGINSSEGKFVLVENQCSLYLPSAVNGGKVVIVKSGDKPLKNPDFLKSAMKISGGRDCFSEITEEEIELSKDMEEYERAVFAKNENKRMTEAIQLLRAGDMMGFGEIVKKSAKEYLSILGKGKSNIAILFDIASEMSPICGIYDNSGVYAVVPENEVDSFMEKAGELYEKKSDRKPEFYVCDFSYCV